MQMTAIFMKENWYQPLKRAAAVGVERMEWEKIRRGRLGDKKEDNEQRDPGKQR